MDFRLTPRQQLWFVVACLAIGSVLRLVWAADMEWKSEEQWMFNEARKLAQGQIPLPPGGIMSSIGIPNPGMGLWCFALIARFATTPVGLVRGVMLLNVVVLWLFFGFVLWQISRTKRLTWLWGLAIASVNPIALVFARKIWIPDLLAPFCLLCFVGHWFRQRFWGAFLWGAASLCAGQVHMGGLFFTLGLWLWTLWYDARRHALRQTAWWGWLLGSALASIPLVYWLWDALPQWQRSSSSIVGLLVPKFYAQWITSALGINLSYPLEQVFWSTFLQEPRIGGIPTYLMVLAHGFLVGVGLWAVYQWFQDRRSPRSPQAKATRHPKLDDHLNALGLGVGGVFTLTATNVVPYYIPIVFPFPFLWLARAYHQRTRWLLAIVLAQLVVSLTFLTFIHTHGGCDDCDYGRTYRVQQQELSSKFKTGKMPATDRRVKL
ncbi:MAG: hypothetical protein F6J87_00625 [Spirulina sp. SIO3F2]|nr:hypothetical protein [Spirulina sp. SIO3F2]